VAVHSGAANARPLLPEAGDDSDSRDPRFPARLSIDEFHRERDLGRTFCIASRKCGLGNGARRKVIFGIADGFFSRRISARVTM
jgi:hypothetical protein